MDSADDRYIILVQCVAAYGPTAVIYHTELARRLQSLSSSERGVENAEDCVAAQIPAEFRIPPSDAAFPSVTLMAFLWLALACASKACHWTVRLTIRDVFS
jgi:hypothetical protein